jgi:hypothetical protein
MDLLSRHAEATGREAEGEEGDCRRRIDSTRATRG